MKQERDRRRWWLGAFALFLGLLGIWILAVILLSPAGASSFSLNLGLGSRLHADYSADEVGRRVGVLRLSIVQDVLRDVGLTDEEAEAQQSEVEVAMGEAVPTATARNFGGEPPHTATPAPTATPVPPVPVTIATDTSEPTSTSTETARPTRRPTRTRTPTRTPTPTGSLNATATRTRTPTPTGATPTRCLANPVVQILSPTGNPIYGIGDSIPAEAFAYDPDNVGPGVCGQVGYYPGDDGVGIDRVDFEILFGGNPVPVYSSTDYSKPFCGFGGGNPCYTFPVSSSTWPGGPSVTSGVYTLRARSRDAGSNYSGWASVYFTLDISTPTATSAPTFSATPSATPPATPTPTDTPPATPTPTDTPTEMPTATAT